MLGTTRRRDLFLTVLEQVRRRYGFVVVGYVVMPEHIHLLIGEPEKKNPSTVMQASNSVLHAAFWHRRNGRATPRKPVSSTLSHSTSGRNVSTISMYGRRKSAWRSCGICIAIQ
jgi:REP element-mobilizing transposase RayT